MPRAQEIRVAVVNSYKREGSLYAVLQAQYRSQKGHSVADEIARAELLPFLYLPEPEALAAFVEYTVFKELRAEANATLLESAIRGGLRLLSPAELETLKALDAAGFMFPWGLLLEATSDIKPIKLLQHLRWGIGKDEVRKMFSGKLELPVEAGYNETGFYSPSYGLPASFFFYFIKGMFGSDKLSRTQIMYFVPAAERPPDDEIERAYLAIRKDLVVEYGPASEVSSAKDAPPEFRQSQMLAWKRPDSILTLSYGLLRDGVPPDTIPLALVYADQKRDPAFGFFARQFFG